MGKDAISEWGCNKDYDDKPRGLDDGSEGEALPPRQRQRSQPVERETCSSENCGGAENDASTEEINVAGRALEHRRRRGNVLPATGASSRPPVKADGSVSVADKPHEDLWVNPGRFEYLDHTADVIIHAWGRDLKYAFEHCGEGLFHYMTDTTRVEVEAERSIEANGHDVKDLLFHFLDELLFLYGSEYFMCNTVEITKFEPEGGSLSAICYGSTFDREIHTQGTEVKAITMHQLRIICDGVDTTAPERDEDADRTPAPEGDDTTTSSSPPDSKIEEAEKKFQVFVLVDI